MSQLLRKEQILLYVCTILGIILINEPAQTNSLEILGVFPHPGRSHFDFFYPIMKGLADAGHNVTVLSHFPGRNKLDNYIDLPLNSVDVLESSFDINWFSMRIPFSHFFEFFMLSTWGVDSCRNSFNSTSMDRLLKSKKQYDVLVIEQFNSDCLLSLAWKLNIPSIVGASSCALMPYYYDTVGNPNTASYIPTLFLGFSEQMTFTQRLSNWITATTFPIMKRLFMDWPADRINRAQFGNDVPSVVDLSKKINLMLLNTHYSLSGPRPQSPAVIEVGGVHIQEPKPLDEKILSFLDSADNGVVYISWGSMIRAATLPAESREELMQVFRTFKHLKFLWKWENETLPNQPDNVFISKWTPQREILCHPKVRVFMTHGGLLGGSEAAHCGVPVIITPLFGDQFLNAAAFVNRKMGRIVHFHEFKKENIEEAIRFSLEQSTQENAKRVSYSYRNRLQAPLETAIWWVEHLGATGGEPLSKSYSIFMDWYTLNLVDVYATVLLALIILISSWVWVIKRFCLKSHISSTSTKLKSQ